MKQLLCTLTATVLSCSAMAQITISAPPPVRPNVLDSFSLPLSMASLPSMAPARGGSWDLDSISIQAAVHTEQNASPTASFSTATFSRSIRCTLIGAANVHYISWSNLRQTSADVLIPGEEITTKQTFGLGGATGNRLDSITFPIQAITYNNPIPVMKFPLRLDSSWSAATSRNLAFNLTVAASGLNNTPAQHRQIRRVLDSVVGWGRMSVPMPGHGGSGWINVLQVQHTEILLDSFFITGAAGPMPAPAALLAQFGLTQGQTTTILQTSFYRAGYIRPLARAVHSGPSFNSAPSAFYMDTKDLPSALSIRRRVVPIAGIRMYPNPVSNDRIYLDIPGGIKEGWSYTIISGSGQVVSHASLAVNDATIAAIALPQSIASGIYYLSLTHAEHGTTVLPLTVQH